MKIRIMMSLAFVVLLTELTGCGDGSPPKTPAPKVSAAKGSVKVPATNPQKKLKTESDVLLTKENKILSKNSLDMKFIYVAPGSFLMGSKNGYKDEKPVHRVTIKKGFWIGKYEVTQKEFQAVMGVNPSHFKGANKPVEMISWHDAVKFCKKLTDRERKAGRLKSNNKYRLPTEVEWEYAARGGNKNSGYKYSGSDNIDSVAWCNNNSDNKTHEVGTKSGNELGIHDMSGNVYEWCNNRYGSYAGLATMSDSERAIRGGAWIVFAKFCRSAYRYKNRPSSRYSRLGFRIVRTGL